MTLNAVHSQYAVFYLMFVKLRKTLLGEGEAIYFLFF